MQRTDKSSAKAILALIALFMLACPLYFAFVVNPKVITELRESPGGTRAQRVMLLSLPNGKTLPVNYLHEGDTVYAGSDFTWHRPLLGDGDAVQVLIKGEQLNGHARVVTNDNEFRDKIFSRLRPTVPTWLPEWAKATLVVIKLDAQQLASR